VGGNAAIHTREQRLSPKDEVAWASKGSKLEVEGDTGRKKNPQLLGRSSEARLGDVRNILRC